MDDDDWTELEDSSATRPVSTVSSHISACGPPTSLSPVAAQHAPSPLRRLSSIDIRVMQPAPTLRRRPVTKAAEATVEVEAAVRAGVPAGEANGGDEAQPTGRAGHRLSSMV